MPILTQPVQELNTHIFFPVIQQVSHRLLDIFGYTDVIGDQIYINTDFSTHSFTHTDDENANINKQCFKVEANIQLNPLSQKWDAYTFHHTLAYGIGTKNLNQGHPIYADTENRVRIQEIRSPVSIDLNCELTLLSMELAYRTPQQIFNGYENGSIHELHDLMYDYPVPKSILSVLHTLWSMDRRKGKPNKVHFLQYLKNNTGKGWQLHKHRDKSKEEYEIVVPVYDLQTLSVLEYSDDKPQGEKEGRFPIGFTIPFRFTLQFALPTMLILEYPVVYNNQIIPSKCIAVNKNLRWNTMPEYWRDYTHDNWRRYDQPQFKGIARFPEYDDWIVPNTPTSDICSQYPMIVAAMTVDENDTLDTTLDVSKDFDPVIKLHDLVKEFYYQEGPSAVNYNVPFGIQVYRDDNYLIPVHDYTFDHDMLLRFRAVNLYSAYHVAFTRMENLNYLGSQWWWLLFKYFQWICEDWQIQIRRRIDHLSNGRLGIDAYGNIYDRFGKAPWMYAQNVLDWLVSNGFSGVYDGSKIKQTTDGYFIIGNLADHLMLNETWAALGKVQSRIWKHGIIARRNNYGTGTEGNDMYIGRS